MEKTLVRFFGGVVMVWGALLGLPDSAHAQSVQIDIEGPAVNGWARQALPQVIHLTNVGGADASNVTVTFTAPKGAKVDSTCLFDRVHGVGSYTCSLGSLTAGGKAEVPFSISMNKSGTVEVEVTCDQGTFAGWLSITIF
jgi:hypothetical protein